MVSRLLVKLLVVVFLFNALVVPFVQGESVLPQTVEKTQIDQSKKDPTFGIWARFFGGFASIVVGLLALPLYPPVGVILIALGARLLWDSAKMGEEYKRSLELEKLQKIMEENKSQPATATNVIRDPTSDL